MLNCLFKLYSIFSDLNAVSGLLDVDQMRDLSNKARLETAFTVADTQLGIARSKFFFGPQEYCTGLY